MKGESSLNPHLIVASLSAPIVYIHCCKIVLMFYNLLLNTIVKKNVTIPIIYGYRFHKIHKKQKQGL